MSTFNLQYRNDAVTVLTPDGREFDNFTSLKAFAAFIESYNYTRHDFTNANLLPPSFWNAAERTVKLNTARTAAEAACAEAEHDAQLYSALKQRLSSRSRVPLKEFVLIRL